MKKSDKKFSTATVDNSLGITGVVLGILSIAFASLIGIALGITALVFAVKQQNRAPNSWGKAGKILAIIGIILSIAAIVASYYLASSGLLGNLPAY